MGEDGQENGLTKVDANKERELRCVAGIEKFCAKLYGASGVPEYIVEKLDELKTKPDLFVYHEPGDEYFKDRGAAGACFDLKDGKFHFREKQPDLGTLVHEMLHYISTPDRADLKTGLRGSGEELTPNQLKKGTAFNEAVTEIAARMVVLGLDPNSLYTPNRLKDTLANPSKYPSLSEVTMSYRAGCNNFLDGVFDNAEFFAKMFESPTMMGAEMCCPFAAIFRKYLTQDESGLVMYFTDVFGQADSNKFFEKVAALPGIERGNAEVALRVLLPGCLEKMKGASAETVRALKVMLDFAERKTVNGMDIRFIYPENAKELISITPEIKISGLNTLSEVEISLDIGDKKKGFRSAREVSQAYLILTAIRLAAAKRGKAMTLSELKAHPDYDVYIKSLTKREKKIVFGS